MVKGKTKSGFKFEIDENKLNEWDVFEAIADMSSGDAQRMVQGTVTFVNTVLGDDKTALFEFIRKKNKGYRLKKGIYDRSVIPKECLRYTQLIENLHHKAGDQYRGNIFPILRTCKCS